jgi:hypothetical protein
MYIPIYIKYELDLIHLIQTNKQNWYNICVISWSLDAITTPWTNYPLSCIITRIFYQVITLPISSVHQILSCIPHIYVPLAAHSISCCTLSLLGPSLSILYFSRISGYICQYILFCGTCLNDLYLYKFQVGPNESLHQTMLQKKISSPNPSMHFLGTYLEGCLHHR